MATDAVFEAFLGYREPTPVDKQVYAHAVTIGPSGNERTRYLQRVIVGHPTGVFPEFTFTTAVTNRVIVAGIVGARHHVVQALVHIFCEVPTFKIVRCGFGTTTLPAETDAAPGAPRMILSGQIAPGSGIPRGTGVAEICQGASGQGILFTCENPSPGKIILNLNYYTTDLP